MVNESKYDIGDQLKDVVSGYVGIVMCISFYSTGCVHYGLAPKKLTENVKVGDWEWIDQSRLTRMKRKAVSFAVDNKKKGGPFPNPQ